MGKGLEFAKKFGLITAGVLIMAFSMSMFMVPNKIAAGGVSGFATVLHYVMSLPTGATIFVINLPLFLMAIRRFGKTFALITLYASFLTSIAVDYIPVPVLTTDPMLASVFGGVVMGVGLGIIERNGGNTGGTYLAAKLLQQFLPFISVAWVMFFIDCLVVLLSALCFSWELGMFSMVALYVSTKVMDMIVEGPGSARMVYVISDQADAISRRIMDEMERGVTHLSAKGGYTGNEKGMIMCVLESNKELTRLKSIVKEEDLRAFVVVNTASEVMGEGFKSHE
ncbi:MAG: YitT family protein [Clostridiales bacterium]|nr:YitT family protein [Clostridiales bacterium]